MNKLTRRQFLRSAALATASVSVLPSVTGCKTSPPMAKQHVRGANEDIRIAVIGFHGRGGSHIDSLLQTKGARITALCDVDGDVLDGGRKKLADGGFTVETYTDIRKLLENKNVDAVTIATPNHWHALGAIWAIQAGKDVYVEKPVSHNVSEGRCVVECARKHRAIVQTGTQSRSSLEGIAAAVEWVQAGNFGKIKIARGLCYKRRDSIGKVSGPRPIPVSVDYDLWCGPAPQLPVRRQKFHYDWHWFWNTGNGDLGNQGIHEMDVARWFLGATELSPRVFSIGGRLGYVDDGETPNTMIIYHDYPGAPLVYEVRGLPRQKGGKEMDKYKGADIGIVIECEGGHVTVPSYTSATAFDGDGQVIKEFKGGESHYDNWLQAVRSRKIKDLNADILEGHLSSALCHTGNISYRLGQQATPEDLLEMTSTDPAALEALTRMEEHLADNGVDLTKTELAIGPALNMNPKTERFIGNPQANEMLTREYRKGYVVPAKC